MKRRDLMAVVSGAAIGWPLAMRAQQSDAGSAKAVIDKKATAKVVASSEGVGVYNEWGKLREVLVGNNARDTLPRWSPDWGRYHGFKEMLAGLEGVPVSRAFPERAKGANEQTNALAQVLQDHGVIVHRPRLLNETEVASTPVGVFAQYARDPQVVIGKHIIETNFRNICRNKEHLGYEQLFLLSVILAFALGIMLGAYNIFQEEMQKRLQQELRKRLDNS